MLKKFNSLSDGEFTSIFEDMKTLVNISLGLDMNSAFDESFDFNGISCQKHFDLDRNLQSEQYITNSYDTLVSCNKLKLENFSQPSCNKSFEIAPKVNSNRGNVIETRGISNLANYELSEDSQLCLKREDMRKCFLNSNSQNDFSGNYKHFSQENDCYLEPFSRENYRDSIVDMLQNNCKVSETAKIPPIIENGSSDLPSLNKYQITNHCDLKCIHQHANHEDLEVLKDAPISQYANYAFEFLENYPVTVPEVISKEILNTENIFNKSCLSITEGDLCSSNGFLEENTLNSGKVVFCRKSTLNNAVKKLICPYCFKSFRYPSHLKRHIFTHIKYSNSSNGNERNKNVVSTTVLNATDSITGKSVYFASETSNVPKNELKKEKSLLQCLYCLKTFRFRSKLQQHTKTHFDEKPCSCHLCSKAFLEKHNLMAHVKIHSTDLPHSCDTSFSHKSKFNRHMQEHMQEKLFI